MSVPEPLRSSPFRMYKRPSMYTGHYGSGPSGSMRSANNLNGGSLPTSHTPSPRTDLSTSPGEYAPHPGPMQTPARDYRSYDVPAVGGMHPSAQPAIPEELLMNEFEAEELEEMDTDALDGHFDDDQPNSPFLAPSENAEPADAFMPIRDGQEISELDSEMRAQMLEIQAAVDRVRSDGPEEPLPQATDPGMAIPQDPFAEQENVFDDAFNELQPFDFDYGAGMEGMFDAQETLFDMPQPEQMSMVEHDMGSLADPGAGSLEQIVEDHGMPDDIPDTLDFDDSLMGPDPAQMGGAAEPMESMEPHPDHLGGDYDMMPQEMRDEQMPGIMDPYMGPEMMDPYMTADPYGPGPMLGPGPGGPA